MVSQNWIDLDPLGTLRTALYRFPGGTSRTTVVSLGDDRLLVYSPGEGLAESARQNLPPCDELFLLAPSASHHLGLADWKKTFPGARVCASTVAARRLGSKQSIGPIEDLPALEKALPDGIGLHVLPACRTGEVWLSVDIANRLHWIVCDAFINLDCLPDHRVARMLLKLGRYGPGLEVSRTFRYLISRDRQAYRDWAIGRLSASPDPVLVPCHGEVCSDANLLERLLDLVRDRF